MYHDTDMMLSVCLSLSLLLGTGTLFKNTERIYKSKSLEDIDQDRLLAMIKK